jgi:hypothetical protein
MSESNTPVFIISLIIILGMTGPSFSLETLERDGIITCNNVVGEVIAKEAPLTLIVQVNDTVGNDITKYNVFVSPKFVSPKAFANYSIGDTHIEPICTVSDYEYYKEIIDMLLDSGILGE